LAYWDAGSLIKAVVLLMVAAAAVCDRRTRLIPNYITLPGCFIGLAWHWVSAGWGGLWFSVLGVLVGFGIFFLPSLIFTLLKGVPGGAMGMGDYKLLAALGSMMGWVAVLKIAILVALWGGVLGVLVLVGQRLASREGGKGGLAYRLIAGLTGCERFGTTHVPYGLAIALGTLTVIWRV